MTRLDLVDDGVQATLTSATEDWSSHRDAAMIALGEAGVELYKADAPTNTGRLSGTIRQQKGKRGNRHILAGGKQGVDYVEPVIEGSKPHPPGPKSPTANKSLDRWASRNNYPGGFYAIWETIRQYGTEANDFTEGAEQRTQRIADTIIGQVLRNRGVLSR